MINNFIQNTYLSILEKKCNSKTKLTKKKCRFE